MKRIASIALILALALIVIVGCSREEEPEAAFEVTEDSELIIWADETRAPVLETLGAQFTETYGVPVTVQQLGFGDIRDNIKVAGPAGEGGDILIGAHDWLGELVTSGILAPIDLGVKENAFTGASLAAFTWDGELYGVPYAVENLALVYNKDYVTDLPKDFAEVRDISVELQEAGTVQYGFVRQTGDPYHFFPIQTAFGGYVFGVNDDGTYDASDVGIDSSGSIAALEWYEAMLDDGHTIPGLDWGGYHEMFIQGDTAMIITGPWALGDLRAGGVNFGIAPIPGGGKPFLGVQGFMVSAFSDNVPMATAFLTEYVATTDTMFQLYELGQRAPAFLDALDKVEDPDLAGFGEAGREGLPMPAIPEMSAVWGSWTSAIDLVINGELDAKEAFEDAAGQIRSAIAGN